MVYHMWFRITKCDTEPPKHLLQNLNRIITYNPLKEKSFCVVIFYAQ